MYNKDSNIQTPLTLGRTNTEYYKTGAEYHILEAPAPAEPRLPMTLKESPDEYISVTTIELKAGRKWSVGEDVETAQSRMIHQYIVDTMNKGNKELGLQTQDSWATADKIRGW